MRRLLVLSCALLAAGAAAAEPDNSPYNAMRTLQVLQEQVAHGNATAQSAQPQLMDHIADGFEAADLAVWKDPRNARAAVLFLLSGGNPRTVRALLDKTAFPAEVDRLLKGSLAYAEGQDKIAEALLDPIDPKSLPSALGGHLALVKAGLLADSDPAKAVVLLDVARLLAPGTLIEEAALRREVFLLLDANVMDKAVFLSRQYIRRYRTSVYADNFKQRFGAMASAMANAGDTARLAKLDSVLNDLTPTETRNFYLSLARNAVLSGKIIAARFAAEKAVELPGLKAAEVARAKLYRAAALVVSDDGTDGLAALNTIDPATLSLDDQALRNAALAVGKAIQANGPKNDDAREPPTATTEPTQATMDRAKAVLAEGDRLLKSAHR